jgi:hypothetical protein
MDIKRWYVFIPPDEWFLITPSVWAFISGALISVAVNLLTGIRLSASSSESMNVCVSTFLFIFSAIVFARISMVLEICKEMVHPKERIRDKKQELSILFLLSLLFLVMGLIFMWI